ncbi:MAG: capsular biosynthesis protein, partial [Sulfurovum sp.]|nr:capsular biosynthesis protein [Sulfurovaceae bacterium]
MSKSAEYDDDEIDLKEIFLTLSRYKYFIIFCMVLFGILAYILGYFKPNIYQTSMTLEIGILGTISSGNDIVSKAISASSKIKPDTEIEILKSRALMVEAVKDIDFSRRYYTTYRMKKTEIDERKSPFDINMTKGFSREFNIFP